MWIADRGSWMWIVDVDWIMEDGGMVDDGRWMMGLWMGWWMADDGMVDGDGGMVDDE
jgi:hypothetical protein